MFELSKASALNKGHQVYILLLGSMRYQRSYSFKKTFFTKTSAASSVRGSSGAR